MKALIGILTIFTLLAACQEDESSGGEPAVYYDYFRVIDAETNKDLFLSHPEYKLDSFKINQKSLKVDVNIEDLPWYTPPYTVTDTAIIFKPTDINDFNLLKFSENDIDTVEQVRKCGSTMNGEDCSILYNSKVFYNGRLADEFDFENNEGLFLQLLKTNGPRSNSPNEDTYIITFEKVFKE